VPHIRRIDLSGESADQIRTVDSQGEEVGTKTRLSGPVTDFAGSFGSHTKLKQLQFNTIADLLVPSHKEALDAANAALLPTLMETLKNLGVNDLSSAKVSHNISIQQSTELATDTSVPTSAITTVTASTVTTTTTVVSSAQPKADSSDTTSSEEEVKPKSKSRKPRKRRKPAKPRKKTRAC
jgi:hypothetical protein